MKTLEMLNYILFTITFIIVGIVVTKAVISILEMIVMNQFIILEVMYGL